MPITLIGGNKAKQDRAILIGGFCFFCIFAKNYCRFDRMANTTGQKFGGRTKGTPNADNKPIKEKFNQLMDGYSIEQMKVDLMAIEKPEERLKIIIGLAEYFLPKMARVELTGEDGNAIEYKLSLNLG